MTWHEHDIYDYALNISGRIVNTEYLQEEEAGGRDKLMDFYVLFS